MRMGSPVDLLVGAADGDVPAALEVVVLAAAAAAAARAGWARAQDAVDEEFKTPKNDDFASFVVNVGRRFFLCWTKFSTRFGLKFVPKFDN